MAGPHVTQVETESEHATIYLLNNAQAVSNWGKQEIMVPNMPGEAKNREHSGVL